jgi:hypothetical protein
MHIPGKYEKKSGKKSEIHFFTTQPYRKIISYLNKKK